VIPFHREAAGIAVQLGTQERAVLADLMRQLLGMLQARASESPVDLLYAQLGIGGPADAPLDPALARLLPDAYRDDRQAASEHRQLTELSLVQRKVANAQAVIDSLEQAAAVLDEAQVQSWLRSLTDLRLTIAARLQIETDDDQGIGDDAMLGIYDWLGYLQGMLIEVIE
jgi:hypothetical protein